VPTLDDVYRKYGETAEAAQLLETELGNMLLFAHVADENLLTQPDLMRAAEVLRTINRNTLGQLLKQLNKKTPMTNMLYFGDNLDWLPRFETDSVDLIYLDPPFNSKASYNLLYRSPEGGPADAQ
jgi:hypothetical protein